MNAGRHSRQRKLRAIDTEIDRIWHPVSRTHTYRSVHSSATARTGQVFGAAAPNIHVLISVCDVEVLSEDWILQLIILVVDRVLRQRLSSMTLSTLRYLSVSCIFGAVNQLNTVCTLRTELPRRDLKITILIRFVYILPYFRLQAIAALSRCSCLLTWCKSIDAYTTYILIACDYNVIY